MKASYCISTVLAVMLAVGSALAGTMPLSQVLHPDGTINTNAGSGSFDPTGWDMTIGPDGQPQFVPAAAAAVAGNENWDDRFRQPALDINAPVRAVAVIGHNVYIAGDFDSIGGISGTRYIAKWDGTSWSALGGGVGTGYAPGVDVLVVAGTDLYVGGWFYIVDGVPGTSGIAKWDGQQWSALGTGIDGFAGAIAVNGANVYVAGGFTTAGGVTVNNIARWNGANWSALGSGITLAYGGGVYALAVQGQDVFAGGYFVSAGGVTVTNVAKWNGSSWSPLGSGVNNSVSTLAADSTDVYAGGSFTKAGGVNAVGIARWNGSSWSALGSGVNSYVAEIVMIGTDVYARGQFSTAGGVNVPGLAKWNGSSWSAVSVDAVSSSYALARDGTDLYVAGWFSSAGILNGHRLAKWNGAAWSLIGTGQGVDGTVRALATSGTSVYAGGFFRFAGPVEVNHFGRWNGSNWMALAQGVRSPANYFYGVTAVAVSGTNLFIGGAFTNAGGVAVRNIAKWDGLQWSPLGPGLGDVVLALTISGTNLIAGGAFTNAGPQAVNHIAQWNGSTWTPLGAGVDGPVPALAVGPDGLYVGGSFYTAGNVAETRGLARWDGSHWHTVGGGLDGYVYALAANETEVYAGGFFFQAGDVAVNYIAQWNGLRWSSLSNGVNDHVYALALRGTDLYAGGIFTSASGASNTAAIAKWDGTAWSSLGSGINNRVHALAVRDTDLFVGGYFSKAGGQPAGSFARWSILTQGLALVTSVLPAGAVGIPYHENLFASGGHPPFNWSLISGALPNGLVLVPVTGAITGTPTAVATANFQIRVTDSSPSPQTATKNLSLTVAPAPPTRIIGLAGDLDFGLVVVGTSATRTLTITNAGTAALTVTGLSLPAGFSGDWAGSIPAGAAQEVTVTFAPPYGGVFGGTLSVASDKTSGSNTIAVAGTGDATFYFRVIGVDGNLAFGEVPVGLSTNLPLTLMNTGNAPLTITGISYPAGFSGAWTGVIPPVTATNIIVTFAPATAGSYSGQVTVASDANWGINTRAISGRGVVATLASMIAEPFALVNDLPVVLAGTTNDFRAAQLWPGWSPVICAWNFGDGTTSTECEPTHSFTNCQNLTVTFTGSDGVVSHETNVAVVVPCELNLTNKGAKVSAKVSFAKPNADSFALSAFADVGPGFVVSNQHVVVSFAGAEVAFVLDAKGKGVSGTHSCSLKYDAETGIAALKVKTKAGNWRAVWAQHGLVEATVSKPGQPVTLPVVVLIGETGFATEKTLLYTAAPGKVGAAK